jgi:myo-inositol-1(or 4)-monophosphatase
VTVEFPRQARSVAIGAALQAGRVIMEGYGQIERVDEKQHHDFVTDVDHRSEKAVIQHIRRAFPDHAILAEESGAQYEHTCRWIIDPLDGTTNFIHGIPMFAVSIALEIAGELQLGVVYEPVRKELFVAEKGCGATLNDRRIYVSSHRTLSHCLLATGFPFRTLDHVDGYLRIFRSVMTQVSGIRRPGSAALDLCYLAAGRVDGFWELNLSPWDIAAGALMIEEAGGRITRFNGDPGFLYRGHVIGSNGLIHDWLLDEARRAFGDQIEIL